MKPAILVLLALALPLAGAGQPGLEQVRSVYLFPMGNGLDQFLANRITNLGLFQVVADPNKADAVFTDRLGESFERRMAELYPEPAAPAKTEEKGEKEGASETKSKQERPVPFSTWGGGKGNIFIVDPQTRSVLWSAYERPKNSTPNELDKTAERIANRLKRELKRK